MLSNQKGLTHILVLILVILVVLGMALLFFLGRKTPADEKSTKLPQSTSNPQSLNNPPQKQWKFKYNGQTLTQTYAIPQVVRDGDYLFFESDPIFNQSGKFEFKQQNIKTGEIKTLKALEDSSSSLGYLDIIDHTLFVSFGGYLRPGYFYSLDLPPTGQLRLIKQLANPNLTKIKDHLFLVGGEGDACWGSSDYSLFNPKTKEVTHVASVENNCGEGTSFEGIDNQNRFLIATSKKWENSESHGFNIGIVTKLEAISLDNLQHQVLVPESKIPLNIDYLYLGEDGKQLFLISPTNIYLLDMVTLEINKLTSLSKPYEQGAKLMSNKLCLEADTPTDTISIDLTSKQTVVNDPICDFKNTDSANQIQQETQAKELMKKLNLPAAYTLVQETL